ncbi:MAG: metal-dependent hydrolase [Pacificimonas sp.]
MDNLAHTLAGAALAEAGLKEKTGLGMATLMIAANLPDIDVIALAFGENLAFRRGITHGPIALLVLPVILVAIMVWIDGWQGKRGKRPDTRLPVRPGWLLALAYIGILSHPLMDWLNVYGIRCLTPFSDQWFYGDTLFIIDVWMWTVLALGVGFSRFRRRKTTPSPRIPAQAAIGAMVAYVGAMGAASAVAESRTEDAVIAAGYGAPDTVIASPPPFNPFHRDMIWRADNQVGRGTVRFAPGPQMNLLPEVFADNMSDPRIAEAAAHSKPLRDFLFWSRVPFARIDESENVTTVFVTDARYSDSPSATGFSVEVDLPAR